MQRISGAQLKDIRTMKKHHTYTPISSQGDLGRRSPLAAIDHRQVLISDDIHEKHLKIKTLDEKLQAHKNEIERNNEMINDLVKNLENLKDQLGQQIALTEAEEKKSKQLRDEMERTNRLLRSKNSKIEELTKKLELIEKENQEFKATTAKTEELTKNLQMARRQSVNLEKQLEEVSSDKKALLKDKDQEIAQLREQLSLLKSRMGDDEELRKSLETKDKELFILRTETSNLNLKLEKEFQEKNAFKINYQTMKKQLQIMIENDKAHVAKERQRQQERKQADLLKERLKTVNARLEQLKNVESRARLLEIQSAELRLKNAQRVDSIQHSRYLYQKSLAEKDGTITVLNSKLSSVQREVQCLQKSLQGANKDSAQLQNIRSKTEQLTSLYSSLIPPLQCNLCHHSLSQPITVIPCGHNFCLNCKKGYTKCCSVCGDKVKIEAVYRNQLLDDIAQIVKNIKELIAMVR